jgi:hypothetical protein
MTGQPHTLAGVAARGTKNQMVKRSQSRRVVFATVDTLLDLPKPCLSNKRSVSAVVEDCQRKKRFYRDRKRRKEMRLLSRRPCPPHRTNSVIMAAHSTPRMSLDLPVSAELTSLSQDMYIGVNYSGSFLPSLTIDDYRSLFCVVDP